MSLLFGAALACYFAASVCYHVHLFAGSAAARRLAPWLVLAGLLLNTLLLGQPWFEPSAAPLSPTVRTVTTIAWTLGLIQLLLDWRLGWSAAGSVTLPLAFALLFYATVLPRGSLPPEPFGRSPMARPHLVATILGFAGLALSFCMAVLYLIQNALLKRKQLAVAFSRLPPLETTARAAHWLAALGFSMLTLGILTGAIAAAHQEPRGWFLSARVLTSLVAWLVYAVYLAASTLGGWRGRRASWVLVGGFGVLLVAYAVNLVSPR